MDHRPFSRKSRGHHNYGMEYVDDGVDTGELSPFTVAAVGMSIAFSGAAAAAFSPFTAAGVATEAGYLGPATASFSSFTTAATGSEVNFPGGITAAASPFTAAATGNEVNNLSTGTAAFSPFTAAVAGSEINWTGPLAIAASSFTCAASGSYTAPFTPTDISGLKGWWRSDLGTTVVSNVCTVWADQSGNSNTLTGAPGPAYSATGAPGTNGPKLSFASASSQTMKSSSAPCVTTSSPFTMFLVFKITTLGSGTCPLYVGSDAFGNGAGFLFNGTKRAMFQSGLAPSVGANNATTNAEMWTYRQSSGSLLYTNDVDQSNTNSGNTPAGGSGYNIVGGDNVNTPYTFSDCEIYEVAIYNSQLSLSDCTRFYNYAHARYGV